MPPPPAITINVPGSGDASLITGQQLIIKFTESVFMCCTCTASTNLFNELPFPASGAQHLKDSEWSGTAIEVSSNQTIEFWTGSNATCPDTTGTTKRSITVGSTSVESERTGHSVTLGSTNIESGATKHSVTVGSTN